VQDGARGVRGEKMPDVYWEDGLYGAEENGGECDGDPPRGEAEAVVLGDLQG
jgi:hypothetical protein